MRIALGIASAALEVLEIRGRTEHVRLNLRHDHGETAGGTNESECAPMLNQLCEERHGTCWLHPQHFDQQMQRDIKGVNLGLQSDLQLQGPVRT